MFFKLPEAQKRRILGPTRYRLYTEGKLGFGDLAIRRQSARWGSSVQVRPLRKVRGFDGSRRGVAAGPPAAPPATPATASAVDWPTTSHLPEKTARALAAGEAEIDKIRGAEQLRAYDGEGNELFRKGGAGFSVGFSSDEVKRLRDAGDRLQAKGQPFVVTHNHPRGWEVQDPTDPNRRGNSFSPDDLDFAVSINASEVRAISPGWVHSMQRPPGGWPGTSNYYRSVQGTFGRIDTIVRQENWDRINAANGDVAVRKEAEAEHFHQVAERVAKEIGATYTRVPRTEP